METTAGATGLQVARAVLTSATVLSLALGAHTIAGGTLPAGLVLAALVALVTLAATALARRRLRLATLVPVLAGVQLALHAALSFLAPGSPFVAATTQAHAHAGGTALLTLATSPQAAPHHEVAGLSMLLAHAAATALTAAVLVGADRAARHAIHWLRSVLPLIQASTAALHVTTLRPHAGESAAARPQAVWVVACRRRGPPAGTVLA